MDRETKTIETPVSKAQVVLNTYITGREQEYIQLPILQSMTMKNKGEIGKQGLDVDSLDISKIHESRHRSIEKIIVSVNGVKENVLDAILDMHNDDYQFVLAAIDEMSKKN